MKVVNIIGLRSVHLYSKDCQKNQTNSPHTNTSFLIIRFSDKYTQETDDGESFHRFLKGCDMVSLAQVHPEYEPIPGHQKQISNEARSMLNHLRVVGMKCRVAARADMFEACALLATDKKKARIAHAEVLMRCLREAIGKHPTIFSPGTESLSFDEAWLVELIEAAARNDQPSFTFLLHSRVLPHARLSMTFLASSVSKQFSLF